MYIVHNSKVDCNVFMRLWRLCKIFDNPIGRVMVSVIDSPGRVKTKYYKIGICCLSTNQSALRDTSNDWLARNQNNVFEWSDMSNSGLTFRCASTKNPTKRINLAQSGYTNHFIKLKCSLFSP